MSIAVSPQGVEFICQFEGFRAFPYRDSGGLLTIGYGTRITENQAGTYKNGISEIEGRQLVSTYLKEECQKLSGLPLGNLLQHQQDAIVSLSYNLGFFYFTRSTIYKEIVERSINLMAWNMYTKDAKGNIDQGLVRRRQKELELFIYGYPQK